MSIASNVGQAGSMGMGAAAPASAERAASAHAKVTRRIVPFIVLCYFFSYLDRVNVGFAKLQMQQALGLSDVVYGIGAGIFFWGYMLCQVPSSLLIYKLGMRRCMAAIMILWGLVSAGTMLVTTPPSSMWRVSCSASPRRGSSRPPSCT